MAKKKKKPASAKAKRQAPVPEPAIANQRTVHPDVAPPDDVFFNDTTDPLPITTPNFAVSGTAIPSNATVSGILTDVASAATFASNPPSVLCSGPNGAWTLQFQNIPPSSYVLGVNEQLPNQGAKAKIVNVSSPVVVRLDPIVTTPTTATVTGTVTSPGGVNLSAVLSMSPPKHGKPKHQHVGSGTTNFRFDFDSLTPNTDFTVTVYPIKGLASGPSKKGKTKP
jgi:hypothetical protein